ncbi:MAG: VanZ family protein [Tepidimonas sp.]|uniref:VanZ family protein n=1 Tax=Tepidimonas sp. TaxID=2002775 RepID=UPI00298F029A|nr:VanZ family protein [Tepidimonas sp.]MDW8336252.1 VanZ family protein [Tepidimonas sp.]
MGRRPARPHASVERRVRHGSLAWPLLGGYTLLVLYASLYPFEGWRDQGVAPWAFLLAPWPRYLTRFDVLSNLAGYVPLGWLATVALARSGMGRAAGWLGWLAPALLSLLLEGLQSYLPRRVPSQADWLLNTAGAGLGALLAWALLRGRLLGSWMQFRQAWQQPGAQPAWALLLLWPAAVLVPAPVPLGVGHGWPALEAALHEALAATPWQHWLPPPSAAVPPSPLGEAALVALAVLLPLLLGYASLRQRWQRALWALLLAVLALALGTMTSVLALGPIHAAAWLTPAVQAGLVAAAGMGVLALALGARAAAVAALLVGAVMLTLLNRAPPPPYLAEWMRPWDDVRFLHLHGVLRGWNVAWPLLAMGAALRLALAPYNPRP